MDRSGIRGHRYAGQAGGEKHRGGGSHRRIRQFIHLHIGFLNLLSGTAILLFMYRDRAYGEIITPLYKLMFNE
jgi:hypothetical protein